MNLRITYRLQKGGAHWTLTVWVNGACTGNLCVREEEVDLLHCLKRTLEAEGASEVR